MLPLLRANCAHRSCSVPGKPWSSGTASAAPALHEGSCKEPAMHLHCSTSPELGSQCLCSGHGCPQQLTAGTAKPAGIHLSTQIFTKYDLITFFKICYIAYAAFSSAIPFINLSEQSLHRVYTRVYTGKIFYKTIVFLDCDTRTFQMLSNHTTIFLVILTRNRNYAQERLMPSTTPFSCEK